MPDMESYSCVELLPSPHKSDWWWGGNAEFALFPFSLTSSNQSTDLCFTSFCVKRFHVGCSCAWVKVLEKTWGNYPLLCPLGRR